MIMLNITKAGHHHYRPGLAASSPEEFADLHGGSYRGLRESVRNVWASDVATRVAAINQPLTSLVLGAPSRMPMPSEMFLRTIPVTSATYEWARYDETHLGWRDTRREMRAKIPRVSSSGTTSTGTVKYRALAAESDVIERAVSAAGGNLLRQAVQPMQLPRMLVSLDQEVEKSTMALAAASYIGAHDRTLVGAAQWDSGTAGGVKSSIEDLANDISRATMMPRNEIMVAMSDSAWQAARFDTSLTTLGGQTNIAQSSFNEADLARHLAVKSVNVFNDPYVDLGDGLGVRPMYGDVCFVFVSPLPPGTINGVDTTYGHETWAVDFRWTAGSVGRPWFDDDTNSDVWPWHAANQPTVVSPVAGGILRDVSAAV